MKIYTSETGVYFDGAKLSAYIDKDGSTVYSTDSLVPKNVDLAAEINDEAFGDMAKLFAN